MRPLSYSRLQGQMLKVYATFCINQTAATQFVQDKLQKNPEFAKFCDVCWTGLFIGVVIDVIGRYGRLGGEKQARVSSIGSGVVSHQANAAYYKVSIVAAGNVLSWPWRSTALNSVQYLQELIKTTPKTHPQYKDLIEAFKVVEECVTVINERKRVLEMQMKIIQISRSIESKEVRSPCRWSSLFYLSISAIGLETAFSRSIVCARGQNDNCL